MNIPKERSQLFNVSAAYGLPVPQVVMDAITESRKARELIWIFLKRMP